MGKKTICLLMILTILTLSLTGCEMGKNRYQAQFLNLFDTLTEIIGYTETKEEFERNAQMIHDELKIYHQLYDIYEDYDGVVNLKTVNENAGEMPVLVDKKIIDLLKFSKQAHDYTHGKTNIALGAVLKIWHSYRQEGVDSPENAKLPPLELLESASLHNNINDIVIDEVNSTVYFKDKNLKLDVGSIAKGYAVEQVAKFAYEKGITSILISVGGNVRVIGNKYKDTPWNVGILNPNKESEQENLYLVNIKDMSMVTSGNYQRTYTVDGKQYHHIIDPDTLFPSEYFTAVTVLCEDSGMADVLSTALFNMSFEKGLVFIEAMEDTEAVWLFKDNTTRYSSGFKAFIKE